MGGMHLVEGREHLVGEGGAVLAAHRRRPHAHDDSPFTNSSRSISGSVRVGTVTPASMRSSTWLGLTSASRRARRSTPDGSRSGTTAPESTTLFGTRILSSPFASVV